MADERFECGRRTSMSPTRSASVILSSRTISFRPFQNSSSRLTLVLCPAITIDRLTTADFMVVSSVRAMRLHLTIGMTPPPVPRTPRGLMTQIIDCRYETPILIVVISSDGPSEMRGFVHFSYAKPRNATDKVSYRISTTAPSIALFKVAQRHQKTCGGNYFWRW
jgi:hypothetical protein